MIVQLINVKKKIHLEKIKFKIEKQQIKNLLTLNIVFKINYIIDFVGS